METLSVSLLWLLFFCLLLCLIVPISCFSVLELCFVVVLRWLLHIPVRRLGEDKTLQTDKNKHIKGMKIDKETNIE